MKKRSIEERVDLLLEFGEDYPEKWIGLPKFVMSIDNSNIDWHNEYQKLLSHHELETSRLYEILKELRRRLRP